MKLTDLDPLTNEYFVDGGSNLSLQDLRNHIQNQMKEKGAPVTITETTAEAGSMFNKTSIPCLEIHHPQHVNDYFTHVLTKNVQGQNCILQFYITGTSRQMAKEAFQENTKVFNGSGRKAIGAGMKRGGAFGTGLAIGGLVGSAVVGTVKGVAKGINALTTNHTALEEEDKWDNTLYLVMLTVLDDIGIERE